MDMKREADEWCNDILLAFILVGVLGSVSSLRTRKPTRTLCCAASAVRESGRRREEQPARRLRKAQETTRTRRCHMW